MRSSLAALLLLAACQRSEPPANQSAPEPPPAAEPAPAAGANSSSAEQLVRRRLGADGGAIRFADARRSSHDGVPVVCGAYEQNGARHRYIVAGEEAFIEPQMRAGEMDRAFREFCGDGERG